MDEKYSDEEIQAMEDAQDIEDVQNRENEPVYLFDDLVKKFKEEGLF